MMTPERFVHYKVGIECIDKEHYEMLIEMDKIVSIAKSGDINFSKEKLLTAFDLVSSHFRREEKFMEVINYKFLAVHKESHAQILLKVKEIINHVDVHGKMIDGYVRTFEELFINHIDHQDMQYADFIKENNISIPFGLY